MCFSKKKRPNPPTLAEIAPTIRQIDFDSLEEALTKRLNQLKSDDGNNLQLILLSSDKKAKKVFFSMDELRSTASKSIDQKTLFNTTEIAKCLKEKASLNRDTINELQPDKKIQEYFEDLKTSLISLCDKTKEEVLASLCPQNAALQLFDELQKGNLKEDKELRKYLENAVRSWPQIEKDTVKTNLKSALEGVRQYTLSEKSSFEEGIKKRLMIGLKNPIAKLEEISMIPDNQETQPLQFQGAEPSKSHLEESKSNIDPNWKNGSKIGGNLKDGSKLSVNGEVEIVRGEILPLGNSLVVSNDGEYIGAITTKGSLKIYGTGNWNQPSFGQKKSKGAGGNALNEQGSKPLAEFYWDYSSDHMSLCWNSLNNLLVSEGNTADIRIVKPNGQEVSSFLKSMEMYLYITEWLGNENLVAGYFDGTIKIFSVSYRSQVKQLKAFDQSVTSLCYLGNSLFFAGDYAGSLFCVDFMKPEVKWTVPKWHIENTHFAFVRVSPDKREVATASSSGEVKIGTLPSLKDFQTVDMKEEVSGLAWSPKGDSVLVLVKNKVVELTKGKGKVSMRKFLIEKGDCLAFAPHFKKNEIFIGLKNGESDAKIIRVGFNLPK